MRMSDLEMKTVKSTKPISGNKNIAKKVMIFLGIPILLVLLTMSITMFNILCEMAETNGWNQIWIYWMSKTIEYPMTNILLPIVICSIIGITMVEKGK